MDIHKYRPGRLERDVEIAALDPEANLMAQRAIAEELRQTTYPPPYHDLDSMASELAALVLAALPKPSETWTFFGHWEHDRVMVEYVLPGEQQDLREDAGYWEQGLWAASNSGATKETAQEEIVAKCEQEFLHGDQNLSTEVSLPLLRDFAHTAQQRVMQDSSNMRQAGYAEGVRDLARYLADGSYMPDLLYWAMTTEKEKRES